MNRGSFFYQTKMTDFLHVFQSHKRVREMIPSTEQINQHPCLIFNKLGITLGCYVLNFKNSFLIFIHCSVNYRSLIALSCFSLSFLFICHLCDLDCKCFFQFSSPKMTRFSQISHTCLACRSS